MPSPPLSALLASVAGLDSALPALPTLSVRQLRPFQSRPWTYSSGTARVACFVSRFEKMAKILDRDTSLSVRGYVFEAFSLEIRRFIPPYCFWGRKNVSRFEKTAEISNRDTFIAEDSASKLVQGSLETSLCWFVMNWSELP